MGHGAGVGGAEGGLRLAGGDFLLHGPVNGLGEGGGGGHVGELGGGGGLVLLVLGGLFSLGGGLGGLHVFGDLLVVGGGDLSGDNAALFAGDGEGGALLQGQVAVHIQGAHFQLHALAHGQVMAMDPEGGLDAQVLSQGQVAAADHQEVDRLAIGVLNHFLNIRLGAEDVAVIGLLVGMPDDEGLAHLRHMVPGVLLVLEDELAHGDMDEQDTLGVHFQFALFGDQRRSLDREGIFHRLGDGDFADDLDLLNLFVQHGVKELLEVLDFFGVVPVRGKGGDGQAQAHHQSQGQG